MRLFEIETLPTEITETMITAFIKEHCQQFLQQAEGLPLYHGFRRGDPRKIVLRTPRNDRKASNTPENIQIMIDDWFKNHGFTALRSNSVFCSGFQDQTTLYGDTYQIFPIGNFSFTWSPYVEDLFIDHFRLSELLNLTDLNIDMDRAIFNSKIEPFINVKQYLIKNISENKIKNLMERLNYRSNDIKAAIRSSNEIALRCEQYIAIPAIYYSHCLERIANNALI